MLLLIIFKEVNNAYIVFKDSTLSMMQKIFDVCK